MKKYLFGIICLLTLIVLDAHPFYVSVTEIKLNSETSSLEISLKIFVDDYEMSRELNGDSKLNLGEENESSEADANIESYLRRRFSVSSHAAKKEFTFLGKECEDDVMWVFLEIKDVADTKELEVYNTILTEAYREQSNLVHLTDQGKVKSLTLNKDNPSGVFNQQE